MDQTVLDSHSQRDRVRRLVVEPLKGRGDPPRGWTAEAMLEDYVLALGRYPEHVLATAAQRVRSDHKRSTWPMAGEFRSVCQTLSEGEPHARPKDSLDVATKISEEAYAYVSRRMSAGDGALLIRSIKAAVDRDIRTFLFVKACDCIRANKEPHVSNAEVDERFAELAEESAGRLRSREGVKNFQMRRAVEKALPAVHRFNPETAARVEEAKAALQSREGV